MYFKNTCFTKIFFKITSVTTFILNTFKYIMIEN